MAEEYQGDDLMVVFGTSTLTGQGKTVSVAEAAGEQEEIDITHRGDTERQILESYAGAQKTNVDVTGLDEKLGVAEVYDSVLNTKSTLWVLPEGPTHTYREGVLQNARMIDRGLEVPFDNATEWSAAFHAKNSITWGTHSTA